MYRNVILEFLALYREKLNNYGYKQMTISLMGRFGISDISSLILRPDEVLTYHIKEPRIYEKSYSFETFSETISDMVVYSKDKVYLLKDNLTSSINDPFYLKDIRDQTFESLVIYPIIKKDEVVGTVIIYFDQDSSSFQMKNNDLVKLFDSLQASQGIALNLNINEGIISNEEYIKIVMLKNTNKCYVDNYLKNKFRLNNNTISLNDSKIKSKINKEIRTRRYRKVELDDFEVYYISKYDHKLMSNELDSLALESINKNAYEVFSLIFIDDLNLDLEITNLFSDANVKKYHVKNKLYLYMIDEVLNNSTIKEFNNTYAKNYNLIVTSKVITSKMNLLKIAKFIDEFRPSSFNFSEYAKYINNINSISLSNDLDISSKQDKYFINSITHEEFTVLPNIINFNVSSDTEAEAYENSIFKLIKNNCSDNSKDYIIPIIPSMLNSKKIFISLEKLLEAKKVVKVIITVQSDKINSLELEKGIVKLKKLGVLVFVDSGIYLNNKTLYLLDICDGLFVHSNEFKMLVKYPSGINTAIYQYMVKNHKELLIDYDFNKVDDTYFNSLFYYYK